MTVWRPSGKLALEGFALRTSLACCAIEGDLTRQVYGGESRTACNYQK